MAKKAAPPMRPGTRKPAEGQRSLYQDDPGGMPGGTPAETPADAPVEQPAESKAKAVAQKTKRGPPPSEPEAIESDHNSEAIEYGVLDSVLDGDQDSMSREEADEVLSRVEGDAAIVAMMEDDAPEPVRRSAKAAERPERPAIRQDKLVGISQILSRAKTADDLRFVGNIIAEVMQLTPAERDILRTCFLFVRRAIETGRQAELAKFISRVTCKRCKAVALFVDTQIREMAVRRDCAICHHHLDFPLWDGTGAYDRPNVFEPLDRSDSIRAESEDDLAAH